MESVENIENFLKSNGNGSGYGAGYGSGYGDRQGSGDGDGVGAGRGYGVGAGRGYGSGYGDGDERFIKIKTYNNYDVFYVDEIPTVFDKIKGNIAIGKIIKVNDFSEEICFIVKNENGVVAHGKTLREACSDLQDKVMANLDVAERIAEFKKLFKKGIAYNTIDFFVWHKHLTGSCKQGRELFVKQHSINLKTDKFTVAEFIEICKNDYGCEIIKKLENYYS